MILAPVAIPFIDEDDGLARDRERGTVAAVERCTTVKRPAGLCADALDLLRGDAGSVDDLVVQVARAVRRNGAEGELFVPGDAEFAGEKDIQGQVQGVGDLKGDSNPAAGYAEDDRILPVGELSQLHRQLPSSVFTACESHLGQLRSRGTELVGHQPDWADQA